MKMAANRIVQGLTYPKRGVERQDFPPAYSPVASNVIPNVLSSYVLVKNSCLTAQFLYL